MQARSAGIFSPNITATMDKLTKDRQSSNQAPSQEIYLFKQSLEHTEHLFYITDSQGVIEYINPAFTRITGYSAEEAVGNTPRLLKSDDMPEEYYQKLWQTLLSGAGWKEEIVNCKKSGEKYHALQIITPIKDEKGNIEHFTAIQYDITEQKEADNRFKELLEEYDSIFNNTLDAIFLLTVEDQQTFRIRHFNAAHEALTGLSNEEARGKTPVDLLGHELGTILESNYRRCLEAGEPIDYEEELDLPGGKRVWQTRLTPVKKGGRIVEIIGVSREITREKELARERDMFFDVSLDMLCIATIDGYFHQLSPMWSQTLGWSDEELLNRPYIEFVHPEDVEATLEAASKLQEGKNIIHFDNRYRCKDGSYRWISWRSFVDLQRGKVFAVARDIQDRKEMERKLVYLSETDPLLHIYNRKKLQALLRTEIKRFHRYHGPLSLVMFDIDNFKKINDNFGHDIGDKVLQALVARVNVIKRETDVFARWGGEEFMLMTRETDAEGAATIAERIRQTMEQQEPVSSTGPVTVSFGVTQFCWNDDEDSVLKRVDQALYHAKNKGRNRVETLLAGENR